MHKIYANIESQRSFLYFKVVMTLKILFSYFALILIVLRKIILISIFELKTF